MAGCFDRPGKSPSSEREGEGHRGERGRTRGGLSGTLRGGSRDSEGEGAARGPAPNPGGSPTRCRNSATGSTRLAGPANHAAIIGRAGLAGLCQVCHGSLSLRLRAGAKAPLRPSA